MLGIDPYEEDEAPRILVPIAIVAVGLTIIAALTWTTGKVILSWLSRG